MKEAINKITHKNWLVWGGLLLLLIFLVLNRQIITLLVNRDVEAIQDFLDDNLLYAYMFMLVIMILQNSFTVFPLLLVITINITLFGFIDGFLWSWVSSVIAAIFVFYAVRYLFQERLIEKFKPELLEQIEANGFAYVFQARIFPLVPTSLVNILAGLSTVRFWPFILATTIGNFIYFFILALIPAGLVSEKVNETLIWVILVSVILLYYLFKLVRKKRKLSN
ncbi:VTT domain-containing protein [Paenisporosarcina quisquiliarum]|uniref:TVP38/TMEM64 family membrane protein n=1 Tax=Paenisporosarcina quisquiliarum TaxID=365346 RepID=A0A9X3REI9_9BACL|nr:VTT domain-containing protein [Paenisporosarcina quisquiliarum]MCZ8537587.1 VTT domain-containing protein [Paenisporosarcina quisquiliarum]